VDPTGSEKTHSIPQTSYLDLVADMTSTEKLFENLGLAEANDRSPTMTRHDE